MGWSGRIDNLGLDESDIRGMESEDRVDKALDFLKSLGEIDSYIRMKPFDTLDRHGIDFIIWPERGQNWLVALQVKSSEKGKEEHVAEFGTKIPCVVVRDSEGELDLCKQILEELSLSTDSLINTYKEAFGAG